MGVLWLPKCMPVVTIAELISAQRFVFFFGLLQEMEISTLRGVFFFLLYSVKPLLHLIGTPCIHFSIQQASIHPNCIHHGVQEPGSNGNQFKGSSPPLIIALTIGASTATSAPVRIVIRRRSHGPHITASLSFMAPMAFSAREFRPPFLNETWAPSNTTAAMLCVFPSVSNHSDDASSD